MRPSRRGHPPTRSILFTTYAPEGVDEAAFRLHLQEIEDYVGLVSPEAMTEASLIV